MKLGFTKVFNLHGLECLGKGQSASGEDFDGW